MKTDANGWTVQCVVHSDKPAIMWAGHAHIGDKIITCGWCDKKCSHKLNFLPGFEEYVAKRRHGGCYGIMSAKEARGK